MYRYQCAICHGNCDAGELINGICIECLAIEQQNMMRTSTITKIINSPSYQMELNLEEMV